MFLEGVRLGGALERGRGAGAFIMGMPVLSP